MDSREPGDGYRVLTGYWQFAVAMIDQAPAKDPWVHAKVFAAQPLFDRHLPKVHCAEEKLVGRIQQK